MTQDIHLAFAHPGERAAATAPDGAPFDRISLRDHIVSADIGAFQQERGQTQRLRFNVVVEVAPLTGPIDDDVDRILSYDRVSEAIDAALAEERLNLLETLAERVALAILAEPQAMRAFVRIEKLDRGPGALGVEIVRRRGASEANPAQASMPRPVVVYLSNNAIAAPDLATRLDRLIAGDAPVVLCVGAADSVAPQAAAPLAQRRIDLLAIEQNAWVLAGRDRRCIVVGTRTELDWAMRHGQISVWAPSKIVLDAVDGPSASPRDALALVAWFAEQMGAIELRVVDAEPPQSEVPVHAEPL